MDQDRTLALDRMADRCRYPRRMSRAHYRDEVFKAGRDLCYARQRAGEIASDVNCFELAWSERSSIYERMPLWPDLLITGLGSAALAWLFTWLAVIVFRLVRAGFA